MYLYVHCSTVYNSQDTEATWVSTDRWMNKEDVVCIYTQECYLTIKNKEILCIMLSERNQSKTNIIQFHLHVKS